MADDSIPPGGVMESNVGQRRDSNMLSGICRNRSTSQALSLMESVGQDNVGIVTEVKV